MNELLRNNNQGMRTVVETFIIEETAELIYDNEQLDKWNELVSELGLTGQTQIVKKEKSPIPFMHLKTSMKNVFETLCPRKVEVEAYNVTPIPVEILDLIALSKREGYFTGLQIWYDDKAPDPACIGYVAKRYVEYTESNPLNLRGKDEANLSEDEKTLVNKWSLRTWDANYYLLGKWADVRHSFEELIEMATKRFISEKGNEYRKAIKEATRKLDDLEIEAFDLFGGEGTAPSIPF